MKKEIIVNRTLEETKVAVLEDGRLFDLFIERRESEKILNNIYKGAVENIVPALNSAFVNIGTEKSAYLGVDDIIAPDKRDNDKIDRLLKVGQTVMVQVYKEPINTKGPKVTMDISLPGRLLVYMPLSANIGVSKNIEDKQEYERLRNIMYKIKNEGVSKGGFIVRTEAEEATEEEIRKEVNYLTRIWTSIDKRFQEYKPHSRIHKDLGIVFQTIRDHFSDEVELMHIDSKKELDDVLDFVKIISPEISDRILLYESKQPIFKVYGIDDEIRNLQSSRVFLKSGGSLIIQEEESLCAIYVNSGKFVSRNSQEDTASATNVEAAQEIARQLRARNLGGIIVIDFIDMKKASNRQKVLEKLREATKGDKAKIKIWPITRLGLIEMTRERKRESFFSLVGDTCPCCKGLGAVLSKESIFIKVCEDLEQMNVKMHKGKIKIKLNADILSYFLDRKHRLKEIFNSDFEIKEEPEIPREDYQIVFE
ncbi:MAG: Rne/Rng family ribonuclease [Elusimicrobiota bacterium]|jgi:ribonuclease G|nr:Rne/Rng family ribonuclease [Elusimicrobiota bacterium]